VGSVRPARRRLGRERDHRSNMSHASPDQRTDWYTIYDFVACELYYSGVVGIIPRVTSWAFSLDVCSSTPLVGAEFGSMAGLGEGTGAVFPLRSPASASVRPGRARRTPHDAAAGAWRVLSRVSSPGRRGCRYPWRLMRASRSRHGRTPGRSGSDCRPIPWVFPQVARGCVAHPPTALRR
jgi:hypothetical protein